MSRCSSMSFFITILLLVNFILVSTAQRATELGKQSLRFTKDDIVSPNELVKLANNNRFIGDLIIGQRRANEVVYQRTFEIANPSGDVYTTPFDFTVDRGIIHYVEISNEPGSYAAVCDRSKSLGQSKGYFNARTMRNSRSKLRIIIAAH